MENKPFHEPKVPLFHVIFFGLGVALLTLINSCGMKSIKTAYAFSETQYQVQGSLDTAVLTSSIPEKHSMKLILASKTFEGPVDIRVVSPQLAKLDLEKAVKFKVSPSTAVISKNSEVEVTISVDVGAKAPVVKEKPVRILIFKSGSRELIYRAEVDLNLLPRVALAQ